MELEAGKLYQVKYNKGWIIAEYVKQIEPHSYKYNNLNMLTFKTGPEKIKHVPLTHQWKRVRAANGYGAVIITTLDKGMEVRPVTEDALAQIARLKAEIAAADEAAKMRRQELKELCD
jgi:hypothetical protein